MIWLQIFAALSSAGLVFSLLQARALRWTRRRVLLVLEERGELSTWQLRQAGVGVLVYHCLFDLEREGLVLRRSDGLSHPERGGRPLYFYRLAEASRKSSGDAGDLPASLTPAEAAELLAPRSPSQALMDLFRRGKK